MTPEGASASLHLGRAAGRLRAMRQTLGLVLYVALIVAAWVWLPSRRGIAIGLAVPVVLALLVWAVIGIHRLRHPDDDDERRDMLEDLGKLAGWLSDLF